MAVSITIGGVTLRFVTFGERPRAFRGEFVRAFDNSGQDNRDNGKRSWAGESDWHTTTEEASLRAAIASGPVSCSGLVLPGGAVVASVTVESSTQGPAVQSGPPDYTAINVRLSVTLEEV